MGSGRENWPLHKLQALGRAQQCHGRYTFTFPRQAQLDVKSKTLPDSGRQVGTPHSQPLCHLSKYPNRTIQLPVLGCRVRSRGRVCAGLEGGKQLYKPTMGPSTQNSGETHCGRSNSDRNSTVFSGSNVVPRTETPVSESPVQTSTAQEYIDKSRVSGGTKKKSEMANNGLACLWEENLRRAGWSLKAIKRAEPALAASTRM